VAKTGGFLLPLDRPEEAYSAAEPVADAAVGGEGASLVLSCLLLRLCECIM
jgi:hypothetical protein